MKTKTTKRATRKRPPKPKTVYLVGSKGGGLSYGGEWDTDLAATKRSVREGMYCWDDPVIYSAVITGVVER